MPAIGRQPARAFRPEGGEGSPQPEGVLQGGDEIETALPIDGLPYYTTGTTEGFNDDYDEGCPYVTPGSPDVVYSWVADFTGLVDIHTCESSHDTKIHVYQGVYTPGSYYACNDDNSDCRGPVWRSWIEQMPVGVDKTCFIVVDGYVDVVNVGCNGDPPIFQELPMNTWVCGTSGNYMFEDTEFRDMDWFEITVTGYWGLWWRVCAEFPVRTWLIYADARCGGAYTLVTESAEPREWLWGEYDEPGHYYFVISVDGWLEIPCGSSYVAQIRKEDPCAVEEMSWGMIKAIYR